MSKTTQKAKATAGSEQSTNPLNWSSNSQEQVMHMLLGSRASIEKAIQAAHSRGLARPEHWSAITPAPNYPAGVMMAVLTKRV